MNFNINRKFLSKTHDVKKAQTGSSLFNDLFHEVKTNFHGDADGCDSNL